MDIKLGQFSILLMLFQATAALHITRRDVVAGAASAVLPFFWAQRPAPSSAIINGKSVTTAEAAAAGVVGLWIDLTNCTVCRHDVPATCSGVLIAPQLVLSAKHCIDVPEELHGSLERVVFGPNIFDKSAPTVRVAGFKKASDYGLRFKGDLVLIKLAGPAPTNWVPQRVPTLPTLPASTSAGSTGSVGSAGSAASAGPAVEGVPVPSAGGLVDLFGFGDTIDDEDSYSSGILQKLTVKVSSTSGEFVYLTPVDATTGACYGDSGGPALAAVSSGGASVASGAGGARRGLLGVVSATAMPCTGSLSAVLKTAGFREFLQLASADLGAPLAPGML